MVGTTTNKRHDNHELQTLSEPQLDMAPGLGREYEAAANLDGEDEPLVASHSDISDVPAKGMLFNVFSYMWSIISTAYRG